MPNNAIEQLRAVNPFPEPLQALPFEEIRRLLDHAPPAPATRPPRHRAGLLIIASVTTLAVAAVVAVVINLLPSGGDGGFSIADAKAAISRGEQALNSSDGAVYYTRVAFVLTQPGSRPIRMVQQLWQGADEMRTTTTQPTGTVGLTDFASLGGITAYYVPRTRTIYLNRPRGAGTPSIAGDFPDPDPTELALGALLNVEQQGVSATASSFAGAFRQFMALPQAHITHNHGVITVTATRGVRHSRMIAHARHLSPILISQTGPDVQKDNAPYTDTYRFGAYRQRLSAAQASKAFDLLAIYPHAHVQITHRQTLRLP